MTPDALRERANQLRKAGNHADALPLYDQLWSEHRDVCTKWDGWGLAYSLQKTKDYARALDISREVFQMDREFDPIRSVYAWSIFQTEIAPKKKHERSVLLKAADGILRLSEQDKFSPYTRTVFAVLDFLKHENTPNPELILDWAHRLDPAQLSATPNAYTQQDGTPQEQASDREKWYSVVCKALFETKQFEACIARTQEALAQFQRLHYGNDVWFERLIARSEAELGQPDAAIGRYLRLLSRKPDAFLRDELAHLYALQGQNDLALRYAGEAALAPGEMEMKVKLFDLLARLLHEKGETDAARAHVELEISLRQRAGYKISSDVHARAGEFGIDLGHVSEPDTLTRSLRPLWESLKFQGQTRREGRVLKLLPNGKAGFLQDDNGASFYFQLRQFRGKAAHVKPELRVSFYVEDSFDPVKQRKSEVAVDVRAA